MSVPFITRDATGAEANHLKLLMSTYTDGSGYEKNPDGSTRPGWRDLERIVAELLNGRAPEDKSIFDILVNSTVNPYSVYGVSVKSKGFSEKAFLALQEEGRVYMELCNSPAKLWEPLKCLGISEEDFHSMNRPNEIGDSVLQTVHSWYTNSGVKGIDLASSVHLTISYSRHKTRQPSYQVHSFPLDFPDGITWKYKSNRCLSGYDPNFDDAVLFDWYALSGGQLKYYPKANQALYKSDQFQLVQADILSIAEKAQQYWPDEWAT